MIVFKKLKYKNFLSSGNSYTEYDLNSRNNTLIIGKNGSGKSTLLDALTFALFGKAYRNINKPSLVNSVNQKDCVVELEFDIGSKSYLVRRGLKPAVFDIVVDDVDVDKMASAKDFQNNFESNIIKMNYKSFCSVVILGSRYDSFMNMTPADRRKVVEDVLDIEIFSEMNVLLKDKLFNLKGDIKSNSTRIELVEEKKNLQQTNIESSIKERQEEIEDKQSRIERYQKESDEDLTIMVEEKRDAGRLYTQIEDKKNPLESKKRQANEIFRDLTKTKNKTTKELKFFTDTDACPTCEQHIEDDFRTRMIDTKGGKVDELQDAIGSLTAKISEIDEGIAKVLLLEQEHDELKKSMNMREGNLGSKRNLIKSIQTEIDRLKAVIADTDHDDRSRVLEEIETELSGLNITKDELNDSKREHDVAHDLLKDSGIKAKIIENYLPVINTQVNKHLRDLDFYVKFELDETFNESIKSRHLDEFTYASFSEGEKARIDLALLFTWRKIAELKNSVNTNLLILDEVFDGSLDAIGADEVMNKLLFKDAISLDGNISDTAHSTTNVFVISHKVDLVDKFQNTLKFEKVKGFSRMVVS